MVRDGEAAWASLQESVKGWLGQAGGKKMDLAQGQRDI
jgi:hypothetical protein